jgi:hypothetical protein
MTGQTAKPDETNRLPPALSNWLFLTLAPHSWISAVNGGWTLAVLPL